MFGSLMYATKFAMETLPNIHLIGVFVVSLTVVYKFKALYPIYVFVIITGLVNGFDTWWIPYIYIWAVLWGMVMLLPKKIPEKAKPYVYMSVCSLHGFLFGILYAPSLAITSGVDFAIKWTIAGIPYDVIHGVSNFVLGVLIMPIIKAITCAEKRTVR